MAAATPELPQEGTQPRACVCKYFADVLWQNPTLGNLKETFVPLRSHFATTERELVS